MSGDDAPQVKIGEIEVKRAEVFSGMFSGARGSNQQASV
jgi:hypothetical protein